MDHIFIGHLIQTLGEVFLAYTVLRVHHGVMVERRIDKKVLTEMHSEQFVGVIGVLFIIVGFIIRWVFI